MIRDNGTRRAGFGIDIQGKTEDITIRNTKFENSAGENQKTGIRISQMAGRVVMQGNSFENSPVHIDDQRPKKAGLN